MKTSSREILKSAISGAGFLIAVILLRMPLWLAALLAVCLYLAIGLLLAPSPATPEPPIALGLSLAERNQFLGACRQSAGELAHLSRQLGTDEFSTRVADLARVARTLIDYFEKKPDTILLASSAPQNLGRLCALLQQYVALRNFENAGQTADEALQKVEEIVAHAQNLFQGMLQQLVERDVEALNTSAHTLAILMAAEPNLEPGSRISPLSAPAGHRTHAPKLPKKAQPL